MVKTANLTESNAPEVSYDRITTLTDTRECDWKSRLRQSKIDSETLQNSAIRRSESSTNQAHRIVRVIDKGKRIGYTHANID